MTILVTGGAGFIGSNFILDWLTESDEPVINLDNLTYAGNLENLSSVKTNSQHIFIKGDIGDSQLIKKLLDKYKPRAILNFAAESHVDRSIHGPEDFINTNIVGTFRLLETCRFYWNELEQSQQQSFRFLQVSTDEVYGSLEQNEAAFNEETRYAPNSPYSASKASADHLVRSYFHTYGLPVLTTNCSNNYGAFQFPEKLIPLVIHNALGLKPIPIYGDGLQIRDWLYVNDHCVAIRKVLDSGTPGEVYNIGGLNEKTNIDIVNKVCELLDELSPSSHPDYINYSSLITYIKDRAGHDRRYAINATKIQNKLNWEPQETFESGLRKTVEWYLNNQNWINNITSGKYMKWIEKQYD